MAALWGGGPLSSRAIREEIRTGEEIQKALPSPPRTRRPQEELKKDWLQPRGQN